jgi:hypothetical protein
MGTPGCLELGSELRAQALEQRDALLVAQQGAARCIEVGAKRGRAVQVLGDGSGAGVEGVHFAARGLEFCQGDVASATLGLSRRSRGGIRRAEWSGALGSELRHGQDVGRGMEVALGVAADQLPILGEGDIAF